MIISDMIRKGKSEQYKIYSNDEYVCLLQAETIVKNHIKKGQEIDEVLFNKIRIESEKISCFNQALNYVSKGMKTKKQIFTNLKQKSYLEESINDSIQKLENYGYVNDENYAKSYIQSVSSYKGKNYIKTQLFSKGVSKETVNKLMCDFVTDDNDIIYICEKFYKSNIKDKKSKEKLLRRLIGKGFLYEQVLPIVNKFNEEVNDDWD